VSPLLSRSFPLALAALAASGSLASEPAQPTEAPVRAERAEVTGARLAQEESAPAHGSEAESWPDTLDSRLAALSESVSNGPTLTAANAVPSHLEHRLARIISSSGGGAHVAVHVRDLEDGVTVFDRGGDHLLNPASNQKLLTALAALELLGADYRFETRVARLDDTLYLIGEGDPSLQIDDLYNLAAELHGRMDVSSLRRIVVDDTAFSTRRFGPGYDPDGPGLSYMAPSGALSLQFNVLEITVRPGRWGEAAVVDVEPPCAHVRIESSARTGRGRPLSIDTARVDDQTVVRVEGSLPAGHAPVVARKRVADPGLFTGAAFADVLARISGEGPLPVSLGRVPTDATTLHVHRSAPLPSVMSPGLKFSNNFTTEQILRTLAWRLTGRPGDWRGGREVLERFWTALGEDPDLLVFENASGLSRTGRLTPRALVDLLALTAREGSQAAAVLPALPASGRDGTLRKRLVRCDGLVRAKTGTLAGVGALSGIVASEDGSRRLAFSILVNGGLDSKRTRLLQDRVVLALVDHVDGK